MDSMFAPPPITRETRIRRIDLSRNGYSTGSMPRCAQESRQHPQPTTDLENEDWT